MKKYLRRLTKTQFLILWFIPFGVVSFIYNRWLGLLGAVLGAIVGWYLGGVLWKKQNAIKNFNYKKFFKKYRVAILNLLILIPVDVLAYHFGGWKIFLAVTGGWILGMIIWRVRKGRW
ncbi:MAG: hypothetical protein IJS69_01020 [Selenomonadaceae bacterium]|nr:hypothetical protein [Selenomonadaceae bacterium]